SRGSLLSDRIVAFKEYQKSAFIIVLVCFNLQVFAEYDMTGLVIWAFQFQPIEWIAVLCIRSPSPSRSSPHLLLTIICVFFFFFDIGTMQMEKCDLIIVLVCFNLQVRNSIHFFLILIPVNSRGSLL
ncbi:hypothetical protein ACJX0J_009973, partial [Zea mays]